MVKGTDSLELNSDQDFLNFLSKHIPDVNALESITNETKVAILDGNVNRVRRIHFRLPNSTKCSYIVKHVPEGGWLARYPTIAFPKDRLEHEINWYRFIESFNADTEKQTSRRIRTPTIYCYDKQYRALVCEDFGDCMLFSKLQNKPVLKSILNDFGVFLGLVHSSFLEYAKTVNPSAENNREFVFRFHIDSPEEVQKIWENQSTKAGGSYSIKLAKRNLEIKLKEQERFLSLNGSYLRELLNELLERFKTGSNIVYTHGDLHPGSLMLLPEGTIGIIDAELSDYGNGSYDIGTLSAHILSLLLLTNTSFKVSIEVVAHFLNPYINTLIIEKTGLLDKSKLTQEIAMYTGAEMLRRLIGPAGFSIDVEPENLPFLLNVALDLLCTPEKLEDNLKDI